MKAGEIALEGVVLAIDWEKLELRLEAQLFTLPNGKSGAIKPSKEKVVHLKTAGIPAATLKERIRVGEKLWVSGRDGGSGKVLEASALRILTTLEKPPEPVVETPAPVQPVEVVPDTPPKPLFPLEGTDGGFTFRLDGAKITTTPFDPRSTLRTRFIAVGADKREMGAHDWNNSLKVRMFAPNGTLIEEVGWTGEIVSNQAPMHEFVWLEFTGRNPKAPDGLTMEQANGAWLDELVFDIPAPRPNQTVKVDKDVTTQQGTILHIDDLKFAPQGEGGTLQLQTNAIPANGAMLVRCQGAALVDPAGDISCNSYSNNHSGLWNLTFGRVPQTENWKLKLRISQFSRNLAVASDRFKVRLKLPMNELPREALDLNAAGRDRRSGLEKIIGTASAENNDVRGDIKSTAVDFGILMVAKMVFRDLSTDPMKVWDYKGSKAWDENGKELRIESSEQLRALEFESDGTPADRKAKTRDMQIFFDAENRPKSVNVHLDLESRRMLEYRWTLTTPLPEQGASLFPDIEAISSDFAPFVLNQITHYTSVDELSVKFGKELLPARGLALVFDARPFILGAGLTMGTIEVRDEIGRPLNPTDSSYALWVDGNVLSKEPALYTKTLFLAEPPTDSKTLEIQSSSSEMGPVLGNTGLDFENVVIAPKQQQ